MDRFVTREPLALPPSAASGAFTRAEVVFYGVEHRGPSFEALVFLNAPDAGVDTPRRPEDGYAGSFVIFGHGGCFGDEGHCEPPPGPRDPFDSRPPSGVLPQTKLVDVTDVLARLDGDGLTVTVIPVVRGQLDGEAEYVQSDVLFFTELRLLAFR
jgi:hypothetical protein